jgi:hypothetical protein
MFLFKNCIFGKGELSNRASCNIIGMTRSRKVRGSVMQYAWEGREIHWKFLPVNLKVTTLREIYA